MKKLFIAAAVIVMAGSMASCGQKTQKAAQDTAATEPVATEQVEAVEIEAVTPESEIPAAAESQKTQPEQANNNYYFGGFFLLKHLWVAWGGTDRGAPPPFCTGTEFELSGWERCGRFRYQLGKSDDYFAGYGSSPEVVV